MPFNGSGLFQRLYSWVTDRDNDVAISAERMDDEFDGIADALSNCITKDGQTTITADLPLGGNKITNLGNPSGAQDAVTRAYLESQLLDLQTTGGTSTAYTADLPGGRDASLTTGLTFQAKMSATNGVGSASVSGTCTNGSTTISSIADTSALYAGMVVTTPADTATFTATLTNGSNKATSASSTTGLAVGQVVTSSTSGIPTGTTIAAIDGTTLTLSRYFTGSTTSGASCTAATEGIPSDTRITTVNASSIVISNAYRGAGGTKTVSAAVSPTMKLGALDAKPIKTLAGTPLKAGDLISGAVYRFTYDGAAWVVSEGSYPLAQAIAKIIADNANGIGDAIVAAVDADLGSTLWRNPRRRLLKSVNAIGASTVVLTDADDEWGDYAYLELEFVNVGDGTGGTAQLWLSQDGGGSWPTGQFLGPLNSLGVVVTRDPTNPQNGQGATRIWGMRDASRITIVAAEYVYATAPTSPSNLGVTVGHQYPGTIDNDALRVVFPAALTTGTINLYGVL